MAYSFLLVVVTLLFLRPSEMMEGLGEARLYEAAILTCLAFSAMPVAKRLMPGALVNQPITACLLTFAAMVGVSNLLQFDFGELVFWEMTVFKVMVLYLLVATNVNSPRRLRYFLGWLGILILAVALLAILQFHGVIAIPALTPFEQREIDPQTGEATVFPRMCGPGIFHDPNDLCVVMALGIAISVYWLGERKLGELRFAWLAPLGVCAYGVALTLSRGGMMAVLAGLAVVSGTRFGAGKSLALAALLLPIVVLIGASRAGGLGFSSEEDTSQSRIQLWSDGLQLFQHSPVTGIGAGQFAEEVGAVVHNTFLHAFAEVGFIGGSALLGAFGIGILAIRRLTKIAKRRQHEPLESPAAKTLLRMQPVVLAIVVSFVVGVLSLSRPYSPMTYLVLGLAAAYLQVAEKTWPGSAPRLSPRMVTWIAGLGMAYLVCARLFVTVFVRWGGT